MEAAEIGGGVVPAPELRPIKLNGYALTCSVVASMISIILGYNVGVMSGAMIFIQEEFDLKDDRLETLAGILNIAAVAGSLLAGNSSDYLGRRYMMMLASILFMLGSIIMGWGPNYFMLCTGRCVAGVGAGFAHMTPPVYVSEIAPGSGFLSSLLPEIGISIGILSGYISNYVFADLTLKLGWRLMFGIAAVPSLFLAIGILWMPESPMWLMMKGRAGDSKNILYMVCNSNEEAELRLREIKRALRIHENSTADVVEVPEGGGSREVLDEMIRRPMPLVRSMMVAGVGVHIFGHMTGIEAVILYGPLIFQNAGVKSKEKLLLATVGIGLTKLTFVAISTFIINRVGRRTLLLMSLSGMTVTLAALGACLKTIELSETKMLSLLVLCIVFVYSFIAFVNIGIAPVSLVYSSEIFPLRLRAVGAGLSLTASRLMNALVVLFFPSTSVGITIGSSFLAFAGLSVMAWLFVFHYSPETIGRSPEEMEELFREGAWSKMKDAKVYAL